MPALIAVNGPTAGVRFEFVGEAVIGRSPACEIALYDGKVSRRHARLRIEGAICYVLDLDSRNGTLVNGARIDREVVLAPGDRVQTGEIQFIYEPAAAPGRAPAEAAIEAVPASQATLPAEQVSVVLAAAHGLIAASTPAAVLRRGLEEATRALRADRAAVLLPAADGRPPEVAATLGGPVAQRTELFRAALERSEAASSGDALAVPLGLAPPLGALVLERDRVFTAPERDLLVHLARFTGEALAAARARLPAAPASDTSGIVGSARPMRKALDQARRVASSVHAILLVGERGTGKSLVARFIHDRGPRREGPLVAVDCRLSARELSETLFGVHEGRPGALERADGGTVYLAEVSSLPPELGEGIARALAARAVARIGSDRPQPSDFQLVAGTCADPATLGVPGSFDPDLWRRISAQQVVVPPLRDRRADVPLLVNHFLERTCRELRQDPPQLSSESVRLLQDYGWPGNVRELRNVVERLVQVAPGLEVGPEELPPEIRGLKLEPGAKLSEMVARLERDAIAAALRKSRGKKIRAAALLGISRPTLDKKIVDYHLEVPRK